MRPIDSKDRTTFAKGIRFFIGILALCHLVALISYWLQWRGLIGPEGILPAGEFLGVVRERVGRLGWYELPTLCWLFGTGRFIDALCAAGVCLSVLVLLRIAPALCLALLWIVQLSLVGIGQIFYAYQWESLLLESTLVAIWVVPWTLRRTQAPFEPPKLGRYLVWWLLFRLMFLSGLVKLTCGDLTWRDLTALDYHYFTQPLPNMAAWYASHLPEMFQRLSCGVMFAIELLGPLSIVGPAAVRRVGALAMIGLQAAIALTGNYAYFNLLTVGLCVAALDDGFWERLRLVGPAPTGPGDSPKPPAPPAAALRWFAALSVGVTFFISVAAVVPTAERSAPVALIGEVLGPFESFNDYGLFRNMTTERPELVFEGSDDGIDWREYTLPFKPGPLSRRPCWAAPYQPRLDWQLWFAAFEPRERARWVDAVCGRLLENDPAVLGLFSFNPFPNHPPRWIRVVRYDYEFTSASERARTGDWWRRSPLDFYVPAVHLEIETK